MNIYCLFCESGKCSYVVRAAEALFDCQAISPRQVQHTWSDGKMVDWEHDLLPGYVFLYFEDEEPEISRLNAMDGVIRCLSDTDGIHKLAGSDEQFALMILSHDGIIGKTQVYQTGREIRICNGVFSGIQTKILKVDRRRGRMQVEIPFAHQTVKTWLQYEIVESVE